MSETGEWKTVQRRKGKKRRSSLGNVLERRSGRSGTPNVGNELGDLWSRYRSLPEAAFERTEEVSNLYFAIGSLLAQGDKRVAPLLSRAEEMVTFGHRTGERNGELEEGWNPQTNSYEFKHPREWERMKELEGPPPEIEESWLDDESEFPPLPGTTSVPKPKPDPLSSTQMHKIDKDKVGGSKDVHVKNDSWTAAAEARLRIEREATSRMRAGLTADVNGREGLAKKGVEDNCSMASSLAEMLEANPELLEEGGLLCRIVGPVEGQGQHKKKDAAGIAASIKQAAQRLKSGAGEGADGNMVLQFIGCFVDGLTEVIEGRETAKEQFDKVWPLFGLPNDDKEKLLKRVEGYKQLAGAASDTLSGKGARKGDTRQGLMPNDPRKQLSDENALVKGDISGSMHSCLLAQELSESLFGDAEIKDMGAPVLVKDKKLLNARAMDALALTAGGRIGENDVVFHTAYEMINGMQAISGAPPVSQPIATEIMDRMTRGTSFTDAMESIFKDTRLPWQD